MSDNENINTYLLVVKSEGNEDEQYPVTICDEATGYMDFLADSVPDYIIMEKDWEVFLGTSCGEKDDYTETDLGMVAPSGIDEE